MRNPSFGAHGERTGTRVVWVRTERLASEFNCLIAFVRSSQLNYGMPLAKFGSAQFLTAMDGAILAGNQYMGDQV